MRSFAVFLLGIILGVIGTLYFPELTSHREQINAELRKQLDALQAQVHDLGNELKNMNLPKPKSDDAVSPSPSASASPK
jgi:Tfp pilus assembly protein PilN